MPGGRCNKIQLSPFGCATFKFAGRLKRLYVKPVTYVIQILSVCFLFALTLFGEASGFVSEFNLMHTWFFCFGSAYLSLGVWRMRLKVLLPSKHFLELRKNSKFHKKPV